MASTIAVKNPVKIRPLSRRKKNANYGSFLVGLAESDSPENNINLEGQDEATSSNMATVGTRRQDSGVYSGRRGRSTPRRRNLSVPEYDPKLDLHQQTYMLSPLMMATLQKTLRNTKGKLFTLPENKIGFHGPRSPLLLSYPFKPSDVGNAIYLNRALRNSQKSPSSRGETPLKFTEEDFPDSKEAREFVRLAYHMRTGDSRTEMPSPRRLKRAKNVAPPLTRAQKLAREKGFILDGIALSNIQEDYAKVQPKLGPAIPPYNAHFDPTVTSYFKFQGVSENLHKTGQTKRNSVSLQGKYVDRFHFIGDGHIYIHKRNRAGAGYSKSLVDGHAQFLSEIGPMDGYNGKYGFRRNTPTLRNCPTPFGTASRSPTH